MTPICLQEERIRVQFEAARYSKELAEVYDIERLLVQMVSVQSVIQFSFRYLCLLCLCIRSMIRGFHLG